MNSFKFNKINDKFRWEDSDMALEFSKPFIQGFSEFIPVNNEEDMMYYYYTIKIFKKVREKDKLVSERRIADFPCMLELKDILKYQLKDDTTINGQKHEYEDGSTRYSKVIETEGFICEDFYSITKNVDCNGEDEQYVVYCGTSFDINGDLNSCGIRTPYVQRKDIKELLKCVNEFVQYSIDENNKQVKKWKNRYEIKNNKIYEYNFDQDKIDKNKIDCVYTVGDIVDIKIVVDNEEIDISNVRINNIKTDTIVLNNGSIIKFNSIVYINNIVSKKQLHYKEYEITRDFLNILSEEEKKEFKDNNVDTLFKRYGKAIIERNCMYREEHNFNIDYNNDNKIEKINTIAKKIIKIIKDIL